MTDPDPKTEPSHALDVLLAEDLTDIRSAAAAAGVPRRSYWAALRAWRSGRLEAVKVGGRVTTSAVAIRRWILRINERPLPEAKASAPRTRRRPRPVTSEAARRFLESRGLRLGPRQHGEGG